MKIFQLKNYTSFKMIFNTRTDNFFSRQNHDILSWVTICALYSLLLAIQAITCLFNEVNIRSEDLLPKDFMWDKHTWCDKKIVSFSKCLDKVVQILEAVVLLSPFVSSVKANSETKAKWSLPTFCVQA